MARLDRLAQRQRRAVGRITDATAASLDRTWTLLRPHLDAVLRQLTDVIQAKLDAGEAVPVSWLYEQQRLQQFQTLVRQLSDGYARDALATTQEAHRQAIAEGMDAAGDLLDATVPRGVRWTFNSVPLDAVQQMAATAGNGQPLSDLFHGFGDAAADAATNTLLTGIGLGWDTHRIARALEDDLDVSRQRAQVIARTEVLRSYNDAALATYRANSDVVEQWIWLADLGPDTCAACLAMNGTEHDLDEDLDDHPNGRCTKVPKTKSWDDILSQAGIDAGSIPDTSADVPDGSDWFDDTSEATQRAVLGPGKYAAYQDGSLSLSDLVGIDDDPDWGPSIYEKPLKAVGG